MKRTLSKGMAVKVVNEVGKTFDGLVTNNWGNAEVEAGKAGPTINVLYVTDDDAKTDPYGNQIERLSSCSHKLNSHAPGRYWYFPDETF